MSLELAWPSCGSVAGFSLCFLPGFALASVEAVLDRAILMVGRISRESEQRGVHKNNFAALPRRDVYTGLTSKRFVHENGAFALSFVYNWSGK